MSTRPDRETAYRVFAAEFEEANYSYAESDEERAPNYVVTPTGVRANRLFAVGVLTEIETVGGEQLRARIVDPTGAFVVYAGQYQPEALSFLEAATPPAFIAVTGKARTYQPEDSNRVFTSVRPETMSEVDAETRDRFTIDAAERTTERVEIMRDALARDERGDELRTALENEDIEIGLAAGIPRAIEHYGTTPMYLDTVERMGLDAARVVAGEREEVRPLSTAPGEGGRNEGSTARTATAETEDSATDEPAAPTPTPGSAAETGTEPEAETADEDAGVPAEAETTADATADPAEEADSSGEIDEPEIGSTDESAVDPEIEGIAGDERESTTDEDDAEPSATDTGTDEFDPEEFELDDDVRERIEETYGTDFETAGEINDPGEADIETPMPEADGSMDAEERATSDEPVADGKIENEPGVEIAETDTEDETRPDEPSAGPDEATADDSDIDPETAVLDAMAALDDGDGAERAAIEERVAEEYGLTPEEADDGIQQALMSGECYESGDDAFTPI